MSASGSPLPTGRTHIDELAGQLAALHAHADRIDRWGRHLGGVLRAGGRLLAAGNGGSAAHAQHLTAELVGRYRDDRPPYSAIALHADTSALTAVSNDYGGEQAFARQVAAHGRLGDVLVALSTSGRSANVLEAVAAARERGLVTWALTGAAPNPLADACDDAVCVAARATATVQEVHQVVVHLLCAAVDASLSRGPAPASTAPRSADGAGGGPRRPRDRRGPPARLVVVGDALLDRDVDGVAERLVPDAPAPVVDDPRERTRPGGAALAAVLAAGDGRTVTLVTALGDDAPGRELAALLHRRGVTVVDLGLHGPTPEKVRVRADGQVLARLDRGGPPAATGPWTDEAGRALRASGGVLVADYGRGLVAGPGVRDALAGAAPMRPVVWDPHVRGAPVVPGTLMATPNRAEAAGFAPGEGGDGIGAITSRARVLRDRWGVGAVVVTLGPGGALLVGRDDSPLVVPCPQPPLGPRVDACGAGDRFAAALAGALADGALPTEAVATAVARAAAFVAAGAVAALDGPEGDDTVAAPAPPHGAEALVARLRAQGRTVVATGGCFDLLHAGHVRMLTAARSLGDALVVCLNSDASVRRLKGPDRPLVAQADRAAVLAGLSCVDAVAVFDEDTPGALLDRLRPDVWAKGADYAVGDLPEAAVVRRWGGQAVVLPYVSGHSTSDLIRKAVDRAHA